MTRSRKIWIGVGVLIGAGVIGNIANDTSPDQKRRAGRLAEAYVIAKSDVKNSLKDPDSYEELSRETYYIREDSLEQNMQVVLDYKAKNSFGAFIRSKQVYKIDTTGKIIEQFKAD